MFLQSVVVAEVVQICCEACQLVSWVVLKICVIFFLAALGGNLVLQEAGLTFAQGLGKSVHAGLILDSCLGDRQVVSVLREDEPDVILDFALCVAVQLLCLACSCVLVDEFDVSDGAGFVLRLALFVADCSLRASFLRARLVA